MNKQACDSLNQNLKGGEVVMKNPMIMTIIVALVVGAAAFFGGMQYQKTQASGPMQGQFKGPNGSGPQGGFQGRSGSGGGNGNSQGMMPVSGEIISQDDTSITVKMQDGSSKIVLLGDNASINKSSEGSKSDLKIGERVAVFGKGNSDGSVTAQSVQLNPQIREQLNSPNN